MTTNGWHGPWYLRRNPHQQHREHRREDILPRLSRNQGHPGQQSEAASSLHLQDMVPTSAGGFGAALGARRPRSPVEIWPQRAETLMIRDEMSGQGAGNRSLRRKFVA